MDVQDMLKEFIKTYGAPLDLRFWMKLIDEEQAELDAEQFGTADHLKELGDLIYVVAGADVVTVESVDSLIPEEERLEIASSALVAAISINSYAKEYGEDIVQEALERIHTSNMSKLGEDGQPIRREDGKILKGPNYKPADLTDLIVKWSEAAG